MTFEQTTEVGCEGEEDEHGEGVKYPGSMVCFQGGGRGRKTMMLALQRAWSCSDLDQKENSIVFIALSISLLMKLLQTMETTASLHSGSYSSIACISNTFPPTGHSQSRIKLSLPR